MANLDNYFRQHKEISELINTIKTMAIKDLIANSKEIATTLNNLSGKLKVHLSMEDRYLYPNLKAKNEAKNIAEKFENEMGNLAKEFLNYKEKYNTYIIITESPINFKNETTKIMKALEDRMSREEKDLYTI